MNISDLSLFAVFFTGLLGGVHCAGMCGGIVSALGLFKQRAVRIPVKIVPATQSRLTSVIGTEAVNAAVPGQCSTRMPSALPDVFLYNLGRIGTYTFLGLIAGGVGSAAWMMQSILPVQQTAYLVSQMLLVLMGIYIAGYQRMGVLLEVAAAPLWRMIKPWATRRLSGRGRANSFLAGSLWGLVPCGMVYAVLSIALVSGGAVEGALLMLVFGLGTLPNLMVLGMSGQWLGKISSHKHVRFTAGLMIIALGVWGITRWLNMVDAFA